MWLSLVERLRDIGPAVGMEAADTITELVEALAEATGGERGWLIEDASGQPGIIHWVALAGGAWLRTTVRTHPFRMERYKSPIRYTRDAGAALRFARKEDAEAVIVLFQHYLIEPSATEHEWPASVDTHPKGGDGAAAPALLSSAVPKADAHPLSPSPKEDK